MIWFMYIFDACVLFVFCFYGCLTLCYVQSFATGSPLRGSPLASPEWLASRGKLASRASHATGGLDYPFFASPSSSSSSSSSSFSSSSSLIHTSANASIRFSMQRFCGLLAGWPRWRRFADQPRTPRTTAPKGSQRSESPTPFSPRARGNGHA